MDVTSPIDGRAASTRLRVRRSVPHVQAGALTLVDLEPRTGRRHQLRRHCLALGAPLLGDDLYATAAATAAVKSRAGLFLQSVEVKLRHPDSERWVEVKADEAPKFQRVVERSLHGFEFARKSGLYELLQANLRCSPLLERLDGRGPRERVPIDGRVDRAAALGRPHAQKGARAHRALGERAPHARID